MNIKKFFKDKKGNIVIIQKPNLLVFTAIILFLLQLIINGQVGDFAGWGFKITILVWSFDEAIRGDSPFRKVLGIIIGTYLIATMLIKFLKLF